MWEETCDGKAITEKKEKEEDHHDLPVLLIVHRPWEIKRHRVYLIPRSEITPEVDSNFRLVRDQAGDLRANPELQNDEAEEEPLREAMKEILNWCAKPGGKFSSHRWKDMAKSAGPTSDAVMFSVLID